MPITYRNLLCPAKVNLILCVGGPDHKGYHPLETLMAKLNWGDRITIKISKASEPEVHAETKDLNIPMEKNLVYRAARLFCKVYQQNLKVSIFLKKVVPTGAGLGGGSSDAATVLKTLWKYSFKNKTYDQKLFRIAASLGSDIPFFLGEDSAWCTGYGERLEPIKIPHLHVVLIFPKVGVPTPWAYGQLDLERKNLDLKRHLKGKPKWLMEGTFKVPNLENDFEALVYKKFPKIKSAHIALAKEGALAARMSGSGSTVFGVFKDKKAAEAARKSLCRQSWRAEVCELKGL